MISHLEWSSESSLSFHSDAPRLALLINMVGHPHALSSSYRSNYRTLKSVSLPLRGKNESALEVVFTCLCLAGSHECLKSLSCYFSDFLFGDKLPGKKTQGASVGQQKLHSAEGANPLIITLAVKISVLKNDLDMELLLQMTIH